MSVKIEKNIPLPTSRIPPVPFADMSIGDSVEVELGRPSDKEALRQRIVRFQKANPGMVYSMHQQDGGKSVRIWRTE